PRRGAISFLVTGDEEGPSINGTTKVLDWLAQRGEQLNACVVGEPTNPSALGDEIKIGRRGSLSCHLTVSGKQGHVAYQDAADNPVPKLAAIVDRLSREHFDDGAPSFAPTNLEVCVIGSDSTTTNVIPGSAFAAFNIRYNTNWRRPTIEAHVRELCTAAAADANADISLRFSGTGDVFLTEAGPLVDTLKAAISTVTGRTPELTTAGGTSDARFIQAYCPVVEFGLVNATIHAIDEQTDVADLWTLKAIYRELLERW
ncbi:MAG: succinyl-diaminopimelate desuccinylase, partial [Pseudomonadota bacterium]